MRRARSSPRHPVPAEYWIPAARFTPPSNRILWFLAGLTGIYVAAGYAVDWAGLAPGMMNQMGFVGAYVITPMFVLGLLPPLLLARFGRILHGAQAEGTVSWGDWPLAWRRCRQEVLNPKRVLHVATVAVIFPVLLTAFGAWKGAIPGVNPFWLDPHLVRIERILHLGHQPWEWLQPLMGHVLITDTVDFLYGWWILLVPAVLTWQCWSTDWHRRAQFLAAFAITWVVLGTVLATILSSAGPAYLVNLGLPGDEFAGLMEYLRGVDATHRLYAIETQNFLWLEYTRDSPNPWTRISAMPSMHVAAVTLYALAFKGRSRAGYGLALCYASLIVLGSIHLGWHYALDAYVGILGAYASWRVSDRCLSEHSRGAAEPTRG